MKTIFNNSSKFVKYALTFMGFAFLLGLIFSLTFGFNTSTEYGKVYEISIYSFDESRMADYEKTAKEVIKNYGYSAAEVRIEEHTECDAVVVRYVSNSKNNAIKIQAELAEKLEMNENLVKVESLTLSNQKSSSIKLLGCLALAAVIVFAYAAIRFDLKMAIATISNLILSAILPLSILAFSRIQLSLTALYVIAIFACISTAIYVFLYSKIKSIEKYQDKIVSFKDNYVSYIEEVQNKAIIPVAAILLSFVVLIFTFNVSLIFVGLAGIVSLAVSLFNAIIFTPCLQIFMNKEGK